MKSQKKIYAFIDSQNLNLGVLSQGWKLDFKRFRVIVPNQRSYSSLFLPFKKYLSFININLKEKLAKKNGSVVIRTKP